MRYTNHKGPVYLMMLLFVIFAFKVLNSLSKTSFTSKPKLLLRLEIRHLAIKTDCNPPVDSEMQYILAIVH